LLDTLVRSTLSGWVHGEGAGTEGFERAVAKVILEIGQKKFYVRCAVYLCPPHEANRIQTQPRDLFEDGYEAIVTTGNLEQ
jgi:hypothetical protein